MSSCNSQNGGKNGDELDCFTFIRAIFGDISYEIHRHSDLFTTAHALYYIDHFVPLLSTSYA
jgi:hypothetical protein